MIAIGFSFEYVLTNLLFVPFMSGAAYNGDMGTDDLRLLGAVDEARHMTLGLECIKFMLEQDPGNVPIVQRWIDKWFWRGYRVLDLVSMMMDYMLPKRVMSWKEAWEVYGRGERRRAVQRPRRYGIKMPKGWEQTPAKARTTCRTRPGAPSTTTPRRAFHTWMPDEDDMAGCRRSTRTPSTSTTARAGVLARAGRQAGNRFYNKTLPMLCQTCQIPMIFTEPGDRP
jgi:phenol hydroxylase P3 protein